jgi:hypothetical protein
VARWRCWLLAHVIRVNCGKSDVSPLTRSAPPSSHSYPSVVQIASITHHLSFFFTKLSHHTTYTTLFPTFHQPPTTTSTMSAPKGDAPNESVLGSIGNSINNAAQYVSESVQGKVCDNFISSEDEHQKLTHLFSPPRLPRRPTRSRPRATFPAPAPSPTAPPVLSVPSLTRWRSPSTTPLPLVCFHFSRHLV